MLIRVGPRMMASRTSEPGMYLSRTRRAEIARACSQSADSGTRAVGRAHFCARTGALAGVARRGAGLADTTVRSTVGSNEIAAGARRGRKLTIIAAAVSAASAALPVADVAGSAAAGAVASSTIVTWVDAGDAAGAG